MPVYLLILTFQKSHSLFTHKTLTTRKTIKKINIHETIILEKAPSFFPLYFQTLLFH